MDSSKTAIVTGAGKRLGAHIASALLERGWTVVAHTRSGTEVPKGAHGVAADLSDLDCARILFDAAAGFGPIRLLVNNASRFAPDSLEDFSPDELDQHMHVNLRAPVLLIAELARRHRGGDALAVNLLDSKIAAPNADFLSYTLSKQALAGFTDVAARALAPSGIRVNAVAPALMLQSPGQTKENFEAMHDRNPLSRGVAPAEVVAALDYLIAAPTVTGEILTIDGGQRFEPPPRDVQYLEP